MKYVIGIDPGTNNAGIAAVGLEPRLPLLCHHNITKSKMKCSICVENVVLSCGIDDNECVCSAIESQFLGQNANSMMKLCWNAGRWQEACDDMGIEFTMVPPKTWITRTLGRLLKSDQVKAQSIQLVKSLYGVDVTDHEAAAIMIARYQATEMMRKGGMV